MRKILIYTILVLVLIVIPAIFIGNSREIEDKYEDIQYISKVANQAKASQVDIKIYYKEKQCLKTVKNVVDMFDNAQIINQEKGEMKVVLNEKTILGDVSCSEKVLIYNVCEMLISPPGFCNGFILEGLNDNNVVVSEDDVCYIPCLLEYYSGGHLEQTYWRSPPCLNVNNYLHEITKSKEKACYEGSCSDENEKGCCASNQCVDDGKCYDENSIVDTDKDGMIEVCLNIENKYMWVDPDIKDEYCINEVGEWMDCNIYETCRYGKNTYSNKDNGLCCGDEFGENFIECQGVGCFADDASCCAENSCVYLGKCYDKGCAELNTERGMELRYCDGRDWIELDNSKKYCELCNNDWGGGECCGDDEDEGSTASKVYLKNYYGMFSTMNSKCTSKLFSCSLLENRCEEFKLNDSVSKYYCDFGVWKDNDLDKKYCEECGEEWIDDCCGDDNNEFAIEGVDGSKACCTSDLSYVQNGECFYTQMCGNNIIEEREECELPNSNNSVYCSQEKRVCDNGRVGTRDEFGNCGDCLCLEDEYVYECIKDECGAGCGSDDDCSLGQKCSKKDCQCHSITSEEILPSCPHSIYVRVNNETFSPGSEFRLVVGIYDKENKPMKDEEFIMDLSVDDEVVGEGIYNTGEKGEFELKKLITNKSYPGKFEYIAKTIYGICPLLSDKVVVEFDIPPKKKERKPRKESEKKNIAETFEFVYYEENIGECGNSEVEIGEMCELDNLCRAGFGCNYDLRIFDSPAYCSGCECSEIVPAIPDSKKYCDSCDSCGDGELNCGEVCEKGKEYLGEVCYNGKIWEEYNICDDCKGYKIELSNFVKDECECECGQYNGQNCVDGDFIQYTDKYFAGCTQGGCNQCLCQDVYDKDSNNDGVEDKCSPEICDNNFDDNDNGLVDEEGCEPYYCDSCNSIFNVCNERKCTQLKEGCYFEETFFSLGFCSSCNQLNYCEEYYYEKENCVNDPCGLSNCLWDDGCCTDTDGDLICDNEDNCYEVFNPEQFDYDKDGYGDECDICNFEAKLQYPIFDIELNCVDGIDEDCDNLLDCKDNDCYEVCNETIS